MGCPDCEEAVREGKTYYYRMGYATVGFISCEKHFLEIKARLEKVP